MKQNQEFTPKYWVMHDKNTDDIFVDTMDKCMSRSKGKYNKLHKDKDGVNIESARDLECILISIVQVVGF